MLSTLSVPNTPAQAKIYAASNQRREVQPTRQVTSKTTSVPIVIQGSAIAAKSVPNHTGCCEKISNKPTALNKTKPRSRLLIGTRLAVVHQSTNKIVDINGIPARAMPF
jgi:hypothetical protein